MKTRKEKLALNLTVLAIAMAVGIAALPRNSAAWSTNHTVEVQWQQARANPNQHAQDRQAWIRWQSEQLKQARLYQEKVQRADTYRARVLSLERRARAQLAKIESWHKQSERIARQKAAKEKQSRTARATAKNKQMVQVLVRAD